MYYLNNTTYNEKTLIGRLRRYFLIYFETFSAPTAHTALKLIPDPLKAHPVFLCVDDTMVSKFGKKSQCTLFCKYHAMRACPGS